MIQLVVLRTGEAARVVDWSSETLTLGRGDWNDLILPHPSVSRNHARLIRRDDGIEVVDLGSRVKLSVGGQAVERAVLRPGDQFGIGDFSVHLVPRKDATPGAGDVSMSEATATDESMRVLNSLFLLSAHFPTMVDAGELLQKMLDKLLEIFRADRGLILLADEKSGQLKPAFARRMDPAALDWKISQTIAQQVAQRGAPVLTTDALAEQDYAGIESIQAEQIRSIVCVPLVGIAKSTRTLGVLYLDSRTANRSFTPQDVKLLDTFARNAAQALEATREKERLRRDVKNLTIAQREAHKEEHNFTNIVAKDRRMVEVLDQVRDIAREDVTTLILGESGTGKELIAKAIHYHSRRKDRPFVPVNCMALPTEVIESELFGHERGAFTGATERRIGRFEMADGGTLFLDEIGDLSPVVQLKLLRVIQEGQIQRVGSNTPVDIDVRLVTATHVDLKDAMKKGRFREDLYYRLNVFNMTLPPLRQRMEDVPALVDFFIQHFNRKMGKSIQGIEPEALKALKSYSWPGNIRELKNVMERAFALARETIITIRGLPLDLIESRGEGFRSDELSIDNYPPDFHLARDLFEKNFLLKYLKESKGNIAQTANRIGLPRKTIYRKLEEFGIPRDSLVDE